MNNYAINFDDYLKKYIDVFNIKKYKKFLDKNIIIYGPPGIGKYSFVLNLIKNLSNTHLKYSKKMVINFNKNDFYFKISDIHYEIDISLLGCNSKLLWHDIFNHIMDSILSKNQNNVFLLLKNFNKINNELLDIFYTYMQLDIKQPINIKFIIITESLSFIPENIYNRCKLITLERITKQNYSKILEFKLDNEYNIDNLINIKDIKKNSFNIEILNNKEELNIYKKITQEIIDNINCKDNFSFSKLREILYDICIFEFNIENLIYNIIKELKSKDILTDKDVNEILLENFKFLKLYNNNYRPIYHLEKIIIYILVKIWRLKEV